MQTVNELKKLTLDKRATFSDGLSYYLSLVKNPQFLADGERLSHVPEFFEALLQPVATFFKSRINVNSFFLVHVKKYHLIHGTLKLSNHLLVTLYYFEDVQSGIAGTGRLGEDENHFFRITWKNNPLQASPAVK